MPFSTTTTPPATDAKVTVKFAGLLLLKPSASSSCEIGVHRFSSDHTFQILVIVSKPQRPPSLIRLVTGPLTRPFAINVNPDPGTGVQAFTPTADPFIRNSPTNDDLDYRWALDMGAVHGALDFNDGARPVATLNAGILYTPNLTRAGLNPELVKGTSRTRLHRLSADLAAAINLSTGSNVVLSWHELGEPRDFTLPRRGDPADTTYTITLLNEPPNTNAASHDELALYYRVLELGGALIPTQNRRRLAVSSAPTTDEIPCMPVVLNR